MIRGRPKEVTFLSDQERKKLNAIAHSRSLPLGLFTRARIVPMPADGAIKGTIADKEGLSQQSTFKWHQSCLRHGLTSLWVEPGSGRPCSISDENGADCIRKPLSIKPKSTTLWSIRSIAKEDTSPRTNVRVRGKAFGLHPQHQSHFTLSLTPSFVEKIRDIFGLYLSPLTKGMVLYVDGNGRLDTKIKILNIFPRHKRSHERKQKHKQKRNE